MPEFAYRAIAPDGSEQTGAVTSPDEARALRDLKDRGLIVFDLSAGGASERPPWYARDLDIETRVFPARAIAEMSQLLSTLVLAKLPLPDALATAGQIASHRGLQAVLAQVRVRVMEGRPLSEAFRDHANRFPPLFLSLIEVGHRSNRLGETLRDAAAYFERDGAIRAKLISAAIYPIILICAAIALLLVVAFYLAPSLAPFFTANDRPMPPLLATLNGLASLGPQTWVATGLAIAGSIGGFGYLFVSKHTAGMRQSLIQSLPWASDINAEASFARHARALAVMLSSGETELRALRSVAEIASFEMDREQFSDAASLLEQGGRAIAAFEGRARVPGLFVELYSVGQSTNGLAKMMGVAADALDRTAATKIERAMTLITPILTLVIGLTIGFLVYAILGAILDVTDFTV